MSLTAYTGRKVAIKTGNTVIVTLVLAHQASFPRSCDIMADLGFGGSHCSHDTKTIASNILDSIILGIIFPTCLLGLMSHPSIIYPLSLSLSWTLHAVEEEVFINKEKFKFYENFQSLTNTIKSSLSWLLQMS